MQAELLFKAGAQLAEGPLWDSRTQSLWWVDIPAAKLHCFDPATGKDQSFDVGQPIGAVVPEEGRGLVLALADGFARFEGGRVSPLAPLPAQDPALRLNDGKCDPAGRFWAGSTAYDGRRGKASLFCLDGGLNVSLKLAGVSCSNGLGWSQDERWMYYIDSPTQRLVRFGYHAASGSIGKAETLLEIPEAEGIPDGLSMDREGRLWIALFNGGKLLHFDPRAGRLLGEIRVEGARQVTSCAFGGPDLGTLYITTAAENLSPEEAQAQPLAGSLFQARPAMGGLKAHSFKAKT
jgi:sugar lactone lactonase YvrE